MDSNSIYTGQLNQRIKIIERQRTTSTTGGKDYEEVDFCEMWAKVEDVSGSEVEDNKILALNVRRYTILYHPTLMLKHITDLYIEQNGQMYNIYSVSELGHQKYIQLKCSKRE